MLKTLQLNLQPIWRMTTAILVHSCFLWSCFILSNYVLSNIIVVDERKVHSVNIADAIKMLPSKKLSQMSLISLDWHDCFLMKLAQLNMLFNLWLACAACINAHSTEILINVAIAHMLHFCWDTEVGYNLIITREGYVLNAAPSMV